MRWIHRDSVIRCDHDGRIRNEESQGWVRVVGVPVLVADDPKGRKIVACPNYGATVKPCTKTEPVRVGYSDFVRVDGHRVVLSHLEGFTDGSPPGQFRYRVRDPRQAFLGADR
ncbi:MULTISPECIES: hypothetical protein [unclassified Micromonospora]|uniref:hypothetical protein n=1 Tax=unclassified Micromonospora TaxID=2617518 RepID=UPI0010347D7A|nr:MULTISPECIES: hypothetical protein [unclassified Micromonospora]QKW14965.1 hypothetical protein HUT12_20760 [Verrucosispora sp. NA02020]TBL29700.1 hypothetical protein EYA84_23975 [Verrucosispora sp. SN26_14.1]